MEITMKLAEEQVTKWLQMKPEGNMMWFLDGPTAPRQITKTERKLWNALVSERYNYLLTKSRLAELERWRDNGCLA